MNSGPCAGTGSIGRCGRTGGTFCCNGLQNSFGRNFRCRCFQREQAEQEGQRCQGVELCALLLHVLDLDFHFLASVIQAAFDGVFRAAQGFRNLLDAHLLIIEHTDDQPLILAERFKDLLHQPGGFLPVDHHFRIVVKPFIQEIDFVSVLVCQFAEQDGLFLFQIVLGFVGSDPFDPGPEVFRAVQLIQTLKCFYIAVLHDIQNGIFVLDQNLGCLINTAVCKFVEIFHRILVALCGQVDHLFCDLVHILSSLSFRNIYRISYLVSKIKNIRPPDQRRTVF